MPSTAIWFGRILVLIGIVGYAYGLFGAGGPASPTALIPAAFGLVLMICGHIAAAKESMRKHLMHVAVLVALLGAVIPIVRLAPKLGELTFSAAVVSQVAMIIVCGLFVVLAVRSFIAARSGSTA